MRTISILVLGVAALLGCERTEPAVSDPVGELPPTEGALSAPEGNLAALDGAPADAVMRFYSGNLPNLMNHPAIHWTRGEPEVVVSGRGALERFELARLDDALARYERLLVERSYEPQGHEQPPQDPDRLVAVSMADLFPPEDEARALFDERQWSAVQNLAPTVVWRHLSGNDGSDHDRVVMYGSSLGLTVLSKTSADTIPMSESRRAFAAFGAAVRGDAAGEPPADDAPAE
jgi:hypothetical protein